MATLLIILFSWFSISVVFCLALARAAGRPTPAPDEDIAPANSNLQRPSTSLRPTSTLPHAIPAKIETPVGEAVVSEP
jgi:hypothetical protein